MMSSVPVMSQPNLDPATVAGFGAEWQHFDQSGLPPDERARIFHDYFEIFPWDRLPQGATGFDLGCGSGRWAALVSERVGTLHCVDASPDALAVAQKNLQNRPNCQFWHASVDAIPLADGSQDFGYSLGVLHHVPDTALAVRQCVAKLKPGAPFLLYLYYALDNRPWWFRNLWRATDSVRRLVSEQPEPVRRRITDAIALGTYWPLARLSGALEKLGVDVHALPLSYYRNTSFYTMRTDARDRFGTQLEQRFTRQEVAQMMTNAGLEQLRFSEHAPYWCAVGTKR